MTSPFLNLNRMYLSTSDRSAVMQPLAGIVNNVIAPRAAETDANAEFPSDAIAALAESGYLGLTLPTAIGGMEQPPRVFAAIVEEIAQACASTAMIYVMHVTATQAIVSSETLGCRDSRLQQIAAGQHLTTLAFSERGSRSQFWSPVSQLTPTDNGFTTDAAKSWITSASHADSYVASAQMPGATSAMDSTLYVTSRMAEGVEISSDFNGLGLRGNDSSPATFTSLHIPETDLLTRNGDGAEMMLQIILPWFAIGTAAMANGLCRSAVSATTDHLSAARFENDDSRLRDLPNLRSRLAEMNVCMEQSRALLAHTVAQMVTPDDSHLLMVLQSRLAAIEAAMKVTDLAMKACGGAAFSKYLCIERLFRDARAGWVMAPTTDHLHEFVGRALTGLPMFQ